MARKLSTCKPWFHKELCTDGDAPFLYAPALPPRTSVQERAGKEGEPDACGAITRPRPPALCARIETVFTAEGYCPRPLA